MPAAAVHLCVARKLNTVLNVDDELFAIGNIAPDCWRNGTFGSRKLSHFKIANDNNFLRQENYIEFYNKYKNHINNPFVLGYLTHLITDAYWRDFVNIKYEIKENGNVIGIRTNDNNIFEVYGRDDLFYRRNRNKLVEQLDDRVHLKYINENYNINNIDNPIEEIDISGLLDSIKYTNEVNHHKSNDTQKVYDIDHILDSIDKCSQFILKELDNLRN